MTRLLAAFAAALLHAVVAHAQTTILFAGSEDVDFSCGASSTCSVVTNSGTFRSAWAREAYSTSNAGSFLSPVFTATTTLWVHAQYCTFSSGDCFTATGNNSVMMSVYDNNGNATLAIRGTGNASQVKISSVNTSGTFTDLVTCSASSFPVAGIAQMDLYINYGTSGQVILYANSVSICSFSGNVTNGDGATTLDQIQFASANTSYGSVWSEVIAATTDTRAMNLFTLYPTGSGNATQWGNSSGSTPCTSLIGGTAINDSNFVYTGSNSQIEECTVHNTFPPGVYNALALVMSGRLLVGSSGPQHFDFLTRVTGTDYASINFAPNNNFNNIRNYIQTVNPATSNPWAVTDFSASGFNIGLESSP